MNFIRTFIALSLPENIISSLSGFIAKTAPAYPKRIRWVKPGNIHLTLAFPGESSLSRLESLHSLLESATQRHSPLSCSLDHFGAFPNRKHIQVFWIGLKFYNEALNQLAKEVRNICTSVGYNLDEKPFHPHLTLARIPDSLTAFEQQEAQKLVSIPFPFPASEFILNSLVLFKSTLSPHGAEYTPLHTYSLHTHE